MVIDTIVDERTLREIYLTGFEIAVDEGKPQTIMSSYNKLNGTHTNENMHLMKDILRGEWGYNGVVVTDWAAAMTACRAPSPATSWKCPAAVTARTTWNRLSPRAIPSPYIYCSV